MTQKPSFAPRFPSSQARYLQCARRHTSLSSLFYRFRRTFDLAAQPKSAILRLTGCSQYAVYLNGQFINRGPLVAGRQTMTVDQFDVTNHLLAGKNVVAVHLLYYTVGAFRLDISGWQGAGFVADLILDGKVAWATDEQWKADIDWSFEPNTSKRSDWMPLLEIVDARRDEDWTARDFDDSAWPAAAPAGVGVPDIEHYEPRPNPPFEFENDDRFMVAACGRVKFDQRPDDFYWFADHSLYEVQDCAPFVSPGSRPASAAIPIHETDYNHVRLVADEYVLGRPTFTVIAPAGTVIDIVWAEIMREGDGLLDPTARMSNWARYICREGEQTFTMWSVIGFKQLELVIHPSAARGEVFVKHLGAQRQWSMRCAAGRFESSDPRYDRLWQAGARTAAVITVDHHCDNTFREHQPWSGDQEWTRMGVYVSEGIHPLTERQFAQFALGQKPDGRFISPYPSAIRFTGTDKQGSLFGDLPDHAAGYICSLWRHYWHSGNRDLFVQLWPFLQRQVAYWQNHRGDDGLVDLKQLTDSWIWVDWLGLKDKAAPLNGIIGCALKAMISIANAIGEDEETYRAQWQAHRQAFIQAFWSAEENLFIDHPLHRPELPENRSQLTNAFAACADMLPGDADRKRLAQSLVAIESGIGVASPPMQGWVFAALEFLEADELVHNLITSQWLTPQIIDEMGTVPEFWEDTPGRVIRSLAQGGSPFISWALTHFVLGVRPIAPGYSQFVVKPAPGSLNRCSGVVPTARGPLSVRWTRTSGDDFDIQIDAPEGCVRRTEVCAAE